jgi:hypothetical protein
MISGFTMELLMLDRMARFAGHHVVLAALKRARVVDLKFPRILWHSHLGTSNPKNHTKFHKLLVWL